MPEGDEVRFEMLVVDLGQSFEVTITDSEGGEYAKTQAASVDLALQMAVPYMAGMAQPHPFANLLRAIEKPQPVTMRRQTGGDS